MTESIEIARMFNNPNMHESQENVNHSKLDELEDQFQSLLR